MTNAHHDATAHHQRCGGESELLGPEQCGDHHVASGLHLTVGLNHDAVTKAVQQERLLRFRESQLPRRPGVLQRRQR